MKKSLFIGAMMLALAVSGVNSQVSTVPGMNTRIW